jgi:hypothetical protein
MPTPNSDEQQAIDEAWAALGYKPQVFPYYNSAGSAQFLNNAGISDAVRGATANITFSIDSIPIMLIGLRITTVWSIVDDPSPDEVALYELVKKQVDPAMTVDLKLSSQSIIGKAIPVETLTGAGGTVWHNFPSPYPMAGSNTLEMDLTRLSSYPTIRDERISPTIYAVLVTQQLRGPLLRVPPTTRRDMPR